MYVQDSYYTKSKHNDNDANDDGDDDDDEDDDDNDDDDEEEEEEDDYDDHDDIKSPAKCIRFSDLSSEIFPPGIFKALLSPDVIGTKTYPQLFNIKPFYSHLKHVF